jgi:hemerythrin
MMFLKWNDSFSVKVNSIDQQHKKLIDLINSFYDNINQGSPKEKLLILINELKKYTIVHFSTEEEYFKKFNYLDFAAHKEEHDKFVATIQNYEERYKSGKLLLTIEVTNFIKKWITQHILGTDKKYIELFQKHGVN